jgi:hypothetical protein
MPQISTTGQLENASREMINRARYTLEHNAPIWETVSHFKLRKGEDTGVFPKVGQVSISRLTEGIDMVDEEEIGMTTVSVTTNEWGAKIILTDKLLRENVAVNWGMVGKQFGNGYKRLRETELIGLFAALNGGTSFGAAAANFSSANAISCLSIARTDKMGDELVMVEHSNAVGYLAREVGTIGSGTIRPVPSGYSERMLGKAWKGLMIWDVAVLETANIVRDSSDDAIGALYSKEAMGILEEKAPSQEKERDASLRAWEMNWVTDFAAFELDDTLGAPLTFDAADPSTSV